jgi:hypothetical protein
MKDKNETDKTQPHQTQTGPTGPAWGTPPAEDSVGGADMPDASVDPTGPATPVITPEMARLQEEIVAVRAELATTVGELVAQVRPRAQVERATAGVRRMAADAFDPNAENRVRARVVLGVVAGVTALVVAGLVRKIIR